MIRSVEQEHNEKKVLYFSSLKSFGQEITKGNLVFIVKKSYVNESLALVTTVLSSQQYYSFSAGRSNLRLENNAFWSKVTSYRKYVAAGPKIPFPTGSDITYFLY